MRKLLWLIPLFFLTPVLLSVLDLYAGFVFGAGFLPSTTCGMLGQRVFVLLISTLLGIIALAYADK